MTALMFAGAAGRTDVLTLLLDHGVDINAQSKVTYNLLSQGVKQSKVCAREVSLAVAQILSPVKSSHIFVYYHTG